MVPRAVSFISQSLQKFDLIQVGMLLEACLASATAEGARGVEIETAGDPDIWGCWMCPDVVSSIAMTGSCSPFSFDVDDAFGYFKDFCQADLLSLGVKHLGLARNLFPSMSEPRQKLESLTCVMSVGDGPETGRASTASGRAEEEGAGEYDTMGQRMRVCCEELVGCPNHTGYFYASSHAFV